MNKENIFIVLFLLMVVGVILVGEAQQNDVEQKITYDNDDHMFEYFNKGIFIMDNFNPVRRTSYYKCEMGKTYPYSLNKKDT